MQYDFFISHASEDKNDVARPLAQALVAEGYRVWFDEMEIVLGDSLRRKIDSGLAKSRYGIVILSHAFFGKNWPQLELDALVARDDGKEKVILPVWHLLNLDEILYYSPILASKLGVTTELGIGEIVAQIKRVHPLIP